MSLFPLATVQCLTYRRKFGSGRIGDVHWIIGFLKNRCGHVSQYENVDAAYFLFHPSTYLRSLSQSTLRPLSKILWLGSSLHLPLSRFLPVYGLFLLYRESNFPG